MVGYPSPMDRVRATRFAVKCCQWLESPEIRKGCTSAVIGIRGSGIVFTDSQKLELEETDFETRRPKVAWWSHLKKLGNILSIIRLLGTFVNLQVAGTSPILSKHRKKLGLRQSKHGWRNKRTKKHR